MRWGLLESCNLVGMNMFVFGMVLRVEFVIVSVLGCVFKVCKDRDSNIVESCLESFFGLIS